MAEEEKILFSVGIDVEDATKGVDELTGSIVELEKTTSSLRNDLKKTDEELAKEGKTREKVNKEIAFNQQQLREERGERNRLIKTINTNANSYDALSQKTGRLRKQQKALDTSTKEGRKQYKLLEKQIAKNNKTLTKADKKVNVFGRNVGNYSGALKGLTDNLSAISPAADMAVGGVKKLSVPLKLITGGFGLIFTAISLVVSGLTSFFRTSEEGQNAFRKLSAIFTTVAGNITDALSAIGRALMNPRQALQDLRDTVQNTFGNVLVGVTQMFFASLLKMFANAGLAWQKFVGLFKDNTENITKAQENIEKQDKRLAAARETVNKGLENSKELYKEVVKGAKSFNDETQREIDIAQALAERESALIALRRESGIQFAKNKSRVQDLLLVTRDLNASYEDQRAALDEANQILLDELAVKERLAEENLNIIQTQNSLSNSTIEDLQREADAEIALFNLRAENAAKRREITNRQNELENRIRAEQKRRNDEEQAEINSFFEEENELLSRQVDAAIGANEAILDSDKARLDMQKENQLAFAQLITDTWVGISDITGQFLSGEIESFGQYLKTVVGFLIDQLTATLIAKQAEILIQSLASPESIATFGIAGVAKAAGIIALTTGASQAAKAALNRFDEGGELKTGMFTGPSHAGGGVQLSANGVPVAEVEGGERFFVINKKSSALIDQLSSINALHGRPFSTPVRFAQEGGEVATQGVSVEDVISIIQQSPIFVSVTDINEEQTRQARVVQNGTI